MKDHPPLSPRVQPRPGEVGNILTSSQSDAINEILSTLVERIPAHFALLVNGVGQTITSKGEINDCNLVTLGALIASDLAASQEIARITGELKNYQMVLREGDRSHNFIIDAGHSLIVYVQVPSKIPLGWARMQIRHAASMLEQATSPKNRKDLSDELDLWSTEMVDLFGQAIDDLWSG